MKKNWIFLAISIAAFAISSSAFTLMYFPKTVPQAGISLVSLLLGITFWGFLIAGIVLQVILSKKIDRFCFEYRTARRSLRMSSKIGIISFFKNIFGAISDVVFVVSIISLVVSFIASGGYSVICYISLTFAFFSFCTHCVFNGKNYYYMVNAKKIEEIHTNSMEESR